MKKLLAIMLMVSPTVDAANIYVVDGGILPEYRPQIVNKLLNESCFSVTHDDKRLRATDSNNTSFSAYYEYRQASLCQNGSGEMHAPGASILRTSGLPGAIGRNGHPDVPVPVNSDTHHSLVADVIKSNTSNAVRQWHVMQEFLIGTNQFGQKDYANYNTLTQGTSIGNTARALNHIADGFFSLDGVRVVNISQHQENTRFTWPCDNNAEVRSDPGRVEFISAVSSLRDKGVAVVVSTANSVRYPSDFGDRLNDNYKMPFPTCLSTTVAVGGLSNQGHAQGAIAPGTDFIANFHHESPFDGKDKTGTSIATPKVSSYLVELMTVNPVLNENQALTALRNTANFHSGQRSYDNGTFRINYSIAVPNFTAAKSSIVDNFWKDFIPLVLGQVDDTRYGWNYGSNIHDNGVLSYFESVNVQQNKSQPKAAFELGSISQKLNNGDATLRYSFRPYDIDTGDEVEFLINDRSYGYLDTTFSGQLGSTQTFCIDPADLTSDGSNNEVKLKLKNSGETWGVTDLKIEVGVVDASCKEVDVGPPALPENPDRLVGTGESFGDAFGEDRISQVDQTFSLSQAKPTPATYNTTDVQRDIRIKFTTRYDSPNNDVLNRTFVEVNGKQLIVTPYSNSTAEVEHNYIIDRRELQLGTNTVEFRPGSTTSSKLWGIKNISIEYVEPVELTVGTQDGSRYGYNETPTRLSNVRVNFESPTAGNAYQLSVAGWDIDSTGEVEVFINGKSLGFLSTFSGGLNAGDTFVLPSSDLVAGDNQIEFVNLLPASNSTSFKEWGVQNLLVTQIRPDLRASDMLLRTSVLREDQPFNVSARVTNVGDVTSGASTLRFYVSDDSTINAADLQIGTTGVPALAINGIVDLEQNVQTSLVDQGKFIGACVDTVSSETNASNNCSVGIPLESKSITVPIIMLLLDEDPAPPPP